MKKSLLELYALAMCFFTLACFTIAFGVAAYAVIGWISPTTTLPNREYSRFQSNDAYWNDFPVIVNAKPKERPPEDQLSKSRVSDFAVAIDSERRENFQTLLKSLIVVLVDLAVFAAHWALAKKSRANAA